MHFKYERSCLKQNAENSWFVRPRVCRRDDRWCYSMLIDPVHCIVYLYGENRKRMRAPLVRPCVQVGGSQRVKKPTSTFSSQDVGDRP